MTNDFQIGLTARFWGFCVENAVGMVKKLEKTHKIVKFYIYYIVYLGVLCIDTFCLLCYNIFIVYLDLSVKVKTANSGSL